MVLIDEYDGSTYPLSVSDEDKEKLRKEFRERMDKDHAWAEAAIGILRVMNGELYLGSDKIGMIDDDSTWKNLIAAISKKQLEK